MTRQKTDKLFLSILAKYNFHPDNQGVHDIHQKVFRILEEQCYGKRVAMWGAGDLGNEKATYAAKFMDKYACSLQNAVCVVDARKDYEGRRLIGLPIILPDALPSYHPDVILITSFSTRKEIAKEIGLRFPHIACLDVYEELAKQGIEMHKDIFSNTSMYVDIFKQRMTYKNCSDFNQKGLELKSLIQKYISIRDIPYILKCIKEYIEQKYPEYRQAEQLLGELNHFLSGINSKVKKKAEDVLLLFLDAFRGCDWYDEKNREFRLLNKMSQKSACFVNMNATAAVTYESMYSIITGKMPMEGDVYERTSFRLEEFEFLNKLHDENYQIHMYFSNAYSPIDEKEDVKYHRGVCLCEELWSVICEMADEEEKCVHFLDATTELHVPFLCGYHTVLPQKMIFSEMGLHESCQLDLLKEQFQNCLDYVDFEVNFFWSFINENMFKVIFSDHAHVVYDEEKEQPYYMYYNDLNRSVHNVLMISGEGIAPQVIDKLTTMKDFNKIMLTAYESQNIIIPHNEIIQYQYYPILNKNIRQKAKEFDKAVEFIDGIKCFRNEFFLAVFTATGWKEFYRMKENKTESCTEKEAHEFLEKIKNEWLSFH